MNGKGITDFLAGSIFWLDVMWVHSLGFLENPSLPQAAFLKRQEKNLSCGATITVKTLQNLFLNITNRLSFELRQNGGHFENVLN